VYRFTHPFLRETLYSLLIFENQRKVIHQRIVEFLLEHSIYDWSTGWSHEKELSTLIHHLLALEGIDSEESISVKGRKQIVIKKVNQATTKTGRVIKSGHLFKYGCRDKKKALEQKYVQLTVRSIEWYTNQDFIYDTRNAKGSVLLEDILRIYPSNKHQKKLPQLKNEAFSFKVQVKNHHKVVGKEGSEVKKMVFTTQNKLEGEEWVYFIEYLKTKQLYQSFVNKFGKVKLNDFDEEQKLLTQENYRERESLHLGQMFFKKVQ